MSGDFNKIPAQCVECPLRQEYVDRNDAVLTRNCVGPSFQVDAFSGSTSVHNGEVVAYDPDKKGVGEIACRNIGLIAWKEALESQYIAAQQSS